MHETDPTIHLLAESALDPAWNMAADTALLEAVNAGRLTGTWVRFYTWTPPAISLGRLQSHADELDASRVAEDGVIVVRRATGGKAVLHDAELTYSVVGALDDATWGTNLHETYRSVTRILSRGAKLLGIDTELAPGRPAEQQGDADLRAACFAVAYGHELVHHGKKICGSAQRRLVRAFLQHGSFLIGHSHTDLARWVQTTTDRRVLARKLRADSTDARAALGRDVDYETVRSAMVDAIDDLFGPRVRPAELPDAVKNDACRLVPAVRVDVEQAALHS